MTWKGKLAALIPIVLFATMILAAVEMFRFPSFLTAALFLLSVYGLPLVLFRLHSLFFPLGDSITDISKPAYNPWWTTHQIQLVYIAIPLIEAPLHFVPGLFSLWLRLWGSRIGRGVYWTPKVEVIDRSLLVMEDGVVVGHLTAFCGHAVSPINGTLSLIVQRIHVGRRAFIGAESRLGPGSKVEAGQMIRPQTNLYWKGVLK